MVTPTMPQVPGSVNGGQGYIQTTTRLNKLKSSARNNPFSGQIELPIFIKIPPACLRHSEKENAFAGKTIDCKK
jgi:hypothetical protein